MGPPRHCPQWRLETLVPRGVPEESAGPSLLRLNSWPRRSTPPARSTNQKAADETARDQVQVQTQKKSKIAPKVLLVDAQLVDAARCSAGRCL